MKYTLLAILFLVVTSVLHAERIDMRKAGANPSGSKLNTALINTTINKLNANGGGTLFFPAGKYLAGAIRLKSNITITDISFANINIPAKQKCVFQNCQRVKLTDVFVNGEIITF